MINSLPKLENRLPIHGSILIFSDTGPDVNSVNLPLMQYRLNIRMINASSSKNGFASKIWLYLSNGLYAGQR